MREGCAHVYVHIYSSPSLTLVIVTTGCGEFENEARHCDCFELRLALRYSRQNNAARHNRAIATQMPTTRAREWLAVAVAVVCCRRCVVAVVTVVEMGVVVETVFCITPWIIVLCE